jgi:beta-glucosidase
LFLSDNLASITPEFKALKRFKKISLKPNETKTVKFFINHKDLKCVNEDLKWISEKGTFTIRIADLKKDFSLKN